MAVRSPISGLIGLSSPIARLGVSAPAVPQIITATVAPATSVLVVGQALDETTNWATFLLTSNYATSAGGETINSVVVNYIGDTATAAEAFIDGENNHFSITVTDTALNTRTFTTSARAVVYTAPIATGSLSNQSFTTSTGNQTYDASGDFSGSGLTFSVNSVTGVTINPSTGVVTFDTDAMALQSGTGIIVTATNSGGFDTSGFDVSITAVAATVPDAPAPTDWDWTDALTGKSINISIISDPPDGGDAILDYEYDVNSSGAWISGGDTIALVAAIPSNGVPTDLRIRAVNGIGPSLPSATKSATATDQTAPDFTFTSYTEGTGTLAGNLDEPTDLYWMVTSNPTELGATIKAGGGKDSAGPIALVSGANSPTILPNNVDGLDYLHLLFEDPSGNQTVHSSQYDFPDRLAAILSSPTDAKDGETASTASVSVADNEGDVRLVVSTSATQPTKEQVRDGLDHTGAAAAAALTQAVTVSGVQVFSPAPSGLTQNTSYTTHFVAVDVAGNISDVISASGFTTDAAVASGINSIGTATSHVPYNAGNPLTLDYTVLDTDSIIIVEVGCQTDNSNETNYGTPTFGGVAMTQVELQANARTGCAMYSIKPSATGSTTFSIDFGIRAMSIFIEEWEGVNTTTPINASAKGTTLGLTLTTVDAAGKIIGISTNADETVPYTVTTPSETIEREGQSGPGSLDGRSGVHSVDVASAGATEGITFAGPGSLTATIIAELNPA